MNALHKKTPFAIAILLSLAAATGHAQQEGKSTKAVLSPELDKIVTKLFDNFQSLSGIAFTYTFDVDGKHKFEGSYVSHEGKVRLERKDLSTPYEVIYTPGQVNDPTPQHRVHVFDGTRHHRLSLPENRLFIKNSAAFTDPYGHVTHPIQAQYGWHVFPGLDGFGVRMRDRNAWKERFADARILGKEVVNGWNTTVVAIRSFPTLPLDLEGRHKKLYLSQDHNFTPVKFTVEGERRGPTISVSKLYEAKVGTTSVFVPLVIKSSRPDHEYRFNVDKNSIVTQPVVDTSTFTIVPPPNCEVYDVEKERQKTVEKTRFLGEENLTAAHEKATFDAKMMGKNLLLFIGDSTSERSHKLSLSFHESLVLTQNAYRYQLVRVDVAKEQRAQEFLEKLGVDTEKSGTPRLVTFDLTGKVLGQMVGANLLDESEVSEFLELHSPKPRDATADLNTALANANKEGKRVLLQETGFACRPCYRLSKFFHMHWDLFENDYILLKVNSAHDVDGHEVMARFQSESTGIPWLAILDDDGKVLATSDGPDGNIGFPQQAKGIDYFLEMLRSTSRNMKDKGLNQIRRSLTKE